MSDSRFEENTLGVVVGGAKRAMSGTAKRLSRVASAHRASNIGTSFIGLGAAILVGLRAVYGLIWFVAQWPVYPRPMAALAAWIVLVAVLVGAIVTARVIGDRLPSWMYALFLTGLASAVALDLVAVWELGHIGQTATAALTAGMGLLAIVTLRDPIEIIIPALVLGVVLIVAMAVNSPLTPENTPVHMTAVAIAVLPAVIGVFVVQSFSRLVQVELDRVLVQSTVSAPRFAVGMLASEQLARLDLAAEELLESIADGKTRLPLEPKIASKAASLATELRLHLIEGRRETWLYHAITESEMLGKSATLVDKSSLAGLLDPGQRDGLLSAAWLLVSDAAKSSSTRTITIQIGPIAPDAAAPALGMLAVPIIISTTGVSRTRVDPAIWDALSRVGRYSDSTERRSLLVEIECLVESPADKISAS